MINITLLGSGETFLTICDLLFKNNNFNITGIGTNSSVDEKVIEFAEKHNITIIYKLEDLNKINLDFIYMLSYAPLIPKEYLDKYLFINTHYAPLPKYRGFHGFVWCIINGEKEAGFTIHKAEDGIDNGSIYYQYKKEIKEEDNVNSLMITFDSQLINNIKKVLINIFDGQIPLSQNEKEAIYVTRRKEEDNLINWSQPSKDIHNFIRALTPPYTKGAFSYKDSIKVNITKAKLLESPNYIERVGKIVNKNDSGILVKTLDNVILIESVIINGVEYYGKNIPLNIGNIFKNESTC